jgi:hypothetical protein
MPGAAPLPNTLGEVVSRVQSLLGDPGGRGWASRAYCLPFINQAYEDITEFIKTGSGKNLSAVVEALGVPQGTQDLSNLQSPGDPTTVPITQPGPWVGLFVPLRMWVKTAGSLPQYYTEAYGPRDTIPHVNPPGITPGNYATRVTIAWIGEKLFMTPVAGATDLQLYGRFNPPRLVKDTDRLVLYNNLTACLASQTAAFTGIERSNPAKLEGWAEECIGLRDNIVANIIKFSSREMRRLGRMGGQGGTSWGWW